MAVTINIPSQVKTYANLAAFPASGSLKTIYIAEDTNKTYRWTGSVYVEISASAAMTWGQIGGTLSNQTDLQNALDAKVPTTRTLTINGTTQDLSANRTFTIPTDLTVGTTPIASGTNGRVLFQGTGNVLQQSSSLFWDNAKDSLGVLNPTPFSGLTASGIDIGIYNTIGSEGNLSVRGFSSLGGISRSAYGAVGSNYYLEKTTGNLRRSFGDLVSVMEMASGGFQFKTASAGAVASLISLTELMRINASGNVLINTTTDAGFRLDVNGNTRINGDITAIRVVSSILRDGNNNAYINNSLINIATTNLAIGGTTVGEFTFTTKTSGGKYVFNNANVLINTTTDAGYKLDVNGTARVKGTGTTSATTALTVQNSSNSNLLQMRDDGVMLVRSNDAIRTGVTNSIYYLDLGRIVVRNGDALGGSQMQIGSNLVPVDSAVLDLNSTTRGFLPPRMTTTQKNAIASPATGLQVYDTTLNQMSYYNGTTWTNI